MRLPKAYYWTGDTALENVALHEMENAKRKTKHIREISTRYLLKASTTELYRHTLSFKTLILFQVFFLFLGQLIFLSP